MSKMNFYYKFINFSILIAMMVTSIMNGCFLIFCPEKMLNSTKMSSYHCMYEYQMLITTSCIFLVLGILILIFTFTIDSIRITAIITFTLVSLPFVIWFTIIFCLSPCTKEISNSIYTSMLFTVYCSIIYFTYTINTK